MSQQRVTINVTATFENTVENMITHLAPHSSAVAVMENIEELYLFFESKVEDNPYIYPRCAELARFGDVTVREFNRNGYRILYDTQEINEDELVINVLLLLRQNQSIQNQLIEHCLLHK